MSTPEKAFANILNHGDKFMRGTVLSLSSRVIQRTPVGDPSFWIGSAPPGYAGGTLRNSWHVSFGSPSTEEAREPSESGAGSLSELSKIESWDFGLSYYLTNNMPYAMVVEEGSSDQAPEGMVRVSLLEAAA